ncbi:MAG: lysophospholipase [Balneolales bacterium]
MLDLSFSNKKEIKINAKKWLPKNKIKSCIFLLHGYAEHSGRFADLIQEFTTSGHAVYAMDYEGHGQSEGVRGCAGSFFDLIADTALFFTRAYRDHDDKKWFILGHGLGGNIAIKLASMFPQYLDGLILTSPAIMIDRKIPKLIQDMAKHIGSIYEHMPVMRLDNRAISRSKDVVDEYNNDPLVYHGCIRAGMALCYRQSVEQATFVLNQLVMPIWVGHGSFDTLHDPAGSAFIINRVSVEDKTLKIYDKLFHNILNEPERFTIMDEIINWIDHRNQIESHVEYAYSTQKTG